MERLSNFWLAFVVAALITCALAIAGATGWLLAGLALPLLLLVLVVQFVSALHMAHRTFRGCPPLHPITSTALRWEVMGALAAVLFFTLCITFGF